MRKKVFLLTVGLAAMTVLVFAQAGPYTLSIGSGAGSLTITKIYSWGHMDGDDATFEFSAGNSATTIWNMGFFVYDEGTGEYVFMDKDFTSTTHTNNRPTDGAITNTSTQITNTGMTFADFTDFTADLQVDLTAPNPGDTARATWAWTFHNTGATTRALRVIWFVDVDSYLGPSNYDDDMTAFAPAVDGAGLAVAVGENDGSGNLDLNKGVFCESSVAPARVFGITSNTGSSYYWSAQQEFATVAPEIVFEIPSSINATIQGDVAGGSVALESADTDSNGVTDAALANDCGAALQVNLNVPPSGNASVSFLATWGKNQVLSGLNSTVPSWSLY
ncbi:MAG: hypothetical protein Kow0059_10070 [Candidatus Sumerlaeia bacterium]